MKVDTPAGPKDQSQNEGIPLEVINNEKQLLASIYTKGILHKDCQELFHKVRAGYENVILHNYDVVELQEVEYFLWKLHYKHIDEFRKKIKQCSISIGRRKEENVKDDDDAYGIINLHMEGFKSFLSEAMKFYKNLHDAFMKLHCPSKEVIAERNGDLSVSLGLEMSKYRYTCHRFLIYLGDLARYGELCKKQDAQNWSVAFSYYLEATVTCPENGNPHNQMALLATYVGDAFLALYHCIRSLAVKEPFPDAWNNLMLLFEENMSRHFHSLPSEAYCDISNSSDIKPLWPTSNAGSNSSTDNKSESSNSAGICELWPLFVRLTSFFLVKRRLEDFPGTLSSTIKCLEVLVQLDDAQLSAALESYESMNLSRKGPYRVLHLVSVLIFILDSLTIAVQRENLKTQISQQQLCELTKLGLVAAFSCMSPLLERCLKGNVQENSALLPAVLVFVEWLVGAFERIEPYSIDQKVVQAMTCFFDALTALLNQLVPSEGQTACDTTALWEDYELRGFEPTASRQASLDFTNQERNKSVNSKNSNRCHRIFLAGLKLANRSNNIKEWLLYNNRMKKFYTAAPKEVSDKLVEVKEPQRLKSSKVKFHEADSPGEYLKQHSEKCKIVYTDEEEVILFNPLLRHNSAPLHKYAVPIDQSSTDRSKEEGGAADERLRRATSMVSGPKQAQLDGPPGFLSDAMNSRHNIPLKQPEISLKNTTTFPAGPPSLSAWVFDSKIGEDRGTLQVNKSNLDSIAEIASEPFADLSIAENKGSMVDSGHVSTTSSTNFPSPYVAPVPSAPLLPDDAFWLADRSSFDENVPVTREADGILGAAPMNVHSDASPIRGPTDYNPVLPGLIPGYPPLVGMSSSEWLYHYRNNYNKPEQSSSPILSFHSNGPQTVSTSHPNYISRFDLLNPWGTHLVSTAPLYMESPQLLPGSFLGYAPDGHRRSNLQFGYQNQYPYVYGGGNSPSPEQQPLLYYLKEWQLQKEPQLGGAAFMGN